jgi:hypothetical protein
MRNLFFVDGVYPQTISLVGRPGKTGKTGEQKTKAQNMLQRYLQAQVLETGVVQTLFSAQTKAANKIA